MTAQSTEVREVLDAHAAACALLSRLFLKPVDETLLTALRDGPALADWPLDADEETVRGIAALKAATGTPLGVLLVDHRDLFEGPDHVLACPYESVYLSEEHLTFEEQTLKVRAFYNRFGLQAPSMGKEPDDHIGLELSFISHLCVVGLDAIEAADDDAETAMLASVADFLEGHLLRWVDDCLDRVVEHATTDFYRGLGHLTRGTVRQLQATFLAP
ncbi:MAG: putative dimethyl sulfoxide reductase chaperone [Actinomycetota bacterium]|nr:putative dimethyl sulfoxide reductase chaperone [Actinomycetota bacterium]